MNVSRPDSPASGQQDAIQISARLVTFRPCTSEGWVFAELADDLSGDGRQMYRIYPVIGWAVLEDEDSRARFAQPVDARGTYFDEQDHPWVLFSRQLFREAQGGEVALSRTQIVRAITDSRG